MGVSDKVRNPLSKLRAIDALKHAGINLFSESENGSKLKSISLGEHTEQKLGRYQLAEVVAKYEDGSYTHRFYLLEVKTNDNTRAIQLFPFKRKEAQVFVKPFVSSMELTVNNHEPESALFAIVSYDNLPQPLPDDTTDEKEYIEYLQEERDKENHEYMESRVVRIPINIDD